MCNIVTGNQITKPDVIEETDLPIEDGRFKKNFTKVTKVGNGAYGEVFKVEHKIDKRVYAVKKIILDQREVSDLKNSPDFREVLAMSNTQHENIVRFFTSWIETHEEQLDDSADESNVDFDQKGTRKLRSKSFSVSVSDAQSSIKDVSFDQSFKDDQSLKIIFEAYPKIEVLNKSYSTINNGEDIKERRFSRRKASDFPIKKFSLYIQVFSLLFRWSFVRGLWTRS